MWSPGAKEKPETHSDVHLQELTDPLKLCGWAPPVVVGWRVVVGYGALGINRVTSGLRFASDPAAPSGPTPRGRADACPSATCILAALGYVDGF